MAYVSKQTGLSYRTEAEANRDEMGWLTGQTGAAATGAFASLPFLFGSIIGNSTAIMLQKGKFCKILLGLGAGFNIAVCMAMLGFLVEKVPFLFSFGQFFENFSPLGLIAGAIWYWKFHYTVQKSIKVDVLGTILTIAYSIAFYAVLLGLIMFFVKRPLSFFFVFFGFAGAVAFYLIVFKKLTGNFIMPGKEEAAE